jgi:hypothetical protein
MMEEVLQNFSDTRVGTYCYVEQFYSKIAVGVSRLAAPIAHDRPVLITPYAIPSVQRAQMP